MDTLKYIISEYGSIMDKETIGVQIGCYTVALLGFTVAVRKVRPFSRFKKPSQIPNGFIEERKQLTGKVKRIDPIGALLMVEHKPLISLPIISKGELPVKIVGVKVSGLGISWLQSLTVEQNVNFVPVKKEKDFIQCQVLLPNKIKGIQKPARLTRKEKILRLFAKREPPFIDLGQSLVKIGFAELDPVQRGILENAENLLYYNSLHSAELYALKKKLGMKYYINLMAQMFMIFGSKAVPILNYYVKELSKKIVKLPKLIMS